MLKPLSPEDAHHVRTYKYTGGDSSPLYAYVLSPFAQWCVDVFVDRSVAPNTITVLGLVISVFGSVLTLIYNPTLGPDGPRWVHFVAGLCIFLYQTLDNMDGKQARKTGSSSALGMFVDHGCDSINAGVSTMALASVLGLGWSPRLLFAYTSSFLPFYFQTWEEYYSGAMILPPFNGPSDGLCICVSACFYAAYAGSAAFHVPLFDLPVAFLPDASSLIAQMGCPSKQAAGCTIFSLIFFGIATAVSSTLVLHFYRVGTALLTKAGDFSVLDAAYSLLPIVLFYPCMVIYMLHSQVAMPQYPVLMEILFSTAFAEMAIHVMAGSICHRPLEPLKRYPAFCVALLTVFSLTYGQQPAYHAMEFLLLLLSATFSSVTLCTYALAVANEFAEALDIHIFKLGKRYQTFQ